MANKSTSNYLDKFFDDDQEKRLQKAYAYFEKNKLINEHDHVSAQNSKSDFSGTTEDLNNTIDSVNERFDKLKNEMQEVKSNAEKNLKIETDKMSQKVEESKGRVVETLGLFVALFTFLSLQVQILKDERDIVNISAMLLLSGGMITFFVLLLDVMIRSKDEGWSKTDMRFTVLFALCVLLIASGVAVLILHR